jgi:acyl-CoA synthetase (AMP-forming)/AMP-acid ligase II
MTWNFSEAMYQFGDGPFRDRTALIHDDVGISFAELKTRCSGIASWLLAQELPGGSHVGHYLRNSNAYMETFTGAGLAGMSHINVNFRYQEEELQDLCNGLDIQVLVYDREFADRVAQIRERLTATTHFVEVGPGTPSNSFAVSLANLYEYDSENFTPCTSADDLILIATGGTTGLPKGTQWRQGDIWRKLDMCRGGNMAALELGPHPASMEEHVANVASLPPGAPVLPLSPLMHGTGMLISMLAMGQGCAVVTTSDRKFSADNSLDTVRRHKVGNMVLVGDAFAIPLLEALDRRADDKPLESLQVLISSGAILSDTNKAGFRAHRPGLVIMDTLGSSEAIGFGVATEEAGVFMPLPTTRVFDDEMQEVQPGSETIGIAYSGGYAPIGYYKEPAKSAETFVEIEGRRYVKTGDRCTVREDGMLILLGRDSTVINSGGEKIYTVEVERVLVDHPAIEDALVVGLPHPRFGKMVVAVVEGPGLAEDTIDVAEIQAFVRSHLADYKVPKQVLAITSLQRTANGKPDYPFVIDFAEQQLAQLQTA